MFNKKSNVEIFDFTTDDNNLFTLLAENYFYIYDLEKDEIIRKSDKIKHLEYAYSSSDLSLTVYGDINGDFVINNVKNKFCYKTNIGEYPLDRAICTFDGNFLFTDINNNLFLYNSNEVNNIDVNIYPDFEIETITYVGDNTFCITLFKGSKVKICLGKLIENRMEIIKTTDFRGNLGVSHRPFFRNGKVWFVALYRPVVKGIECILTYDITTGRISIEYVEEICDSMQRIDLSPSGEEFVMISFDEMVVMNAETKHVLVREKKKFLSCVKWVDKNLLLLGTWNGLFTYEI